ncbi:alpha/beta hydrolase [Tumebacillus permanentifrigoris]|uniref:Lysophospholipase n=1 Tax=Tumebacillus permanentifrigoris TaxID=378543 RepID=A0A316DAH2_9BACL|nr:alpha/beta hydrolase [Tumebacillus permanentifrigoris]PWK12851.1 lysophospholipase [Tumebacillus permanentifrigoris]
MSLHTQTFLGREQVQRTVPLTVVLVHGAGEHSGRYGHVIEALTARGISVITGDLPGHGRSGGISGHVESFDEYLDSVSEWMKLAEASSGPDGHVAIIGHSMGGLVTVRFLEERAHQHQHLIGAVLSSPCLKLALEVPGWKKSLAGVLNSLAPRLRMASGIQPSDVSRHPTVVSEYGNDPLMGRKVSVRWFQELNAAMETAVAQAQRISVPLLVMQAGQDRLVDPAVAPVFYNRLPAHELHKFVPFHNLYHELFNEPEREAVLAATVEWLESCQKTNTLK